MAKVQGSPEALNHMAMKMIKVIEDEKRAMQSLLNTYNEVGKEWNDTKYRQLGDIVNGAQISIKRTINDLDIAVKRIRKMESDLRAYLSN